MTQLSDRTQIDAVLLERARMLARRPIDTSAVPNVQLLAFGAGGERYAIDIAGVYRLERCTRITPLPGAARHFAGITNLHGQLVPLVDLGRLLGTAPCTNPAFAVVLGLARAEIGIVAETLLELRALPLELFASAVPAPRPLVRHITPDGIAVIDAVALEENTR